MSAVLGEGATAKCLLAKKNEEWYALKKAKGCECESSNGSKCDFCYCFCVEAAAHRTMSSLLCGADASQHGLVVAKEIYHNALLLPLYSCTLDEYISRFGKNGLPPTKTLELTCGLVRALHALQSKCGLSHRDLKAQNILVDGPARIAIADFGSVFPIGGRPSNDLYVCTRYFRAPEVMQKKPYDARIDTWALGLNVLYMLCGFCPWLNCDGSVSSVSDILERLEQLLDDTEVFSLQYYLRMYKAHPVVANVVSRCLVFEPHQRATVDELMLIISAAAAAE